MKNKTTSTSTPVVKQARERSKKSAVANKDIPSATEKIRSSHVHAHGLQNEGTNVDYEESR